MSYLTNKSVPAVADRVKREAINMRFNALSFVGQNASTRVHSTFVSSHLSPLFLILPLPQIVSSIRSIDFLPPIICSTPHISNRAEFRITDTETRAIRENG